MNEADNLLTRHGIDIESIPTIRALTTEANNLTQGKRRNLHAAPVYKWEVHYGRYTYQVGPAGCNTALTDQQAIRLRTITREIDRLLCGFQYDTDRMIVTIPCAGKCRYCDPDFSYTARYRVDALANS